MTYQLSPSIDAILNDVFMTGNKSPLLDDGLLSEMKSYGLPMSENDISSFFDIDNCENWNLKNLVTTLLDPLNSVLLILKDEWQKAKTIAIDTYDKLKNLDIKKLLNDAWNYIKDALIDIYKKIKEQFGPVIEFFKSTYRSIVNLFKKIKNAFRSKEERQKLKEQLKAELKRIGGDICEMLGIYIIIEFVKDAWKCIKNIFGNGKSFWKGLLDGLKEIGDILGMSEIINSFRIGSFATIIRALIPLLIRIAVIVLCIIEINKAQKKCDEKLLNDESKFYHPNGITENKNSELSELLSKLSLKNNGISSDPNLDSSIISICPVYENSDAYITPKNNGYILEIGKDITDYNFNISIDQHITLNSEIGNIMNIPIKSKIEGIVKERTDRHILIEKIEYNNSELIEKINNISISAGNTTIENDETSKSISEISDKLKRMNEIEILIKDYLNEIYKPLLYGESIANNRIANDYNDVNITAEEQYNVHIALKNELDNFIKDHGKPEVIEPYAEKNNLKELTNIILNKKYYVIDSILNNIDEYRNRQLYISNEDNCLFCDYYLTFMMLECDNNEYFDKLYNIINKFYVNRFEYESHNISELKNKFNKKLKDSNIKNVSFETIKKNLNGNNSFENVKKHLEIKYPQTTENRNGIIKMMTNLYLLILGVSDIKCQTSLNKKELLKITNNEAVELYKFILDLKTKYIEYKNLLNNLLSGNKTEFDSVNWPMPSEIYIDNIQYTHYLFTSQNVNSNLNTDLNDKDINLNDKDDYGYNDILSGITANAPNTLAYWQKYCAVATLTNCILPAYWSTGLVLLGAPIPMPIILLPFTYIDGKVSCVIGLAICGLAIAPLTIIINGSDLAASVLIPINLMIDMSLQLLEDLKNAQFKAINLTTKPMIEDLNRKIKEAQDEIKLLKQQISTYKNL